MNTLANRYYPTFLSWLSKQQLVTKRRKRVRADTSLVSAVLPKWPRPHRAELETSRKEKGRQPMGEPSSEKVRDWLPKGGPIHNWPRLISWEGLNPHFQWEGKLQVKQLATSSSVNDPECESHADRRRRYIQREPTLSSGRPAKRPRSDTGSRTLRDFVLWACLLGHIQGRHLSGLTSEPRQVYEKISVEIRTRGTI